MSDHDSQKIIAVFDSFAWADEAARFLKLWDQSLAEVKFGTVSLVYVGDAGQIKVRNHGSRNIVQGGAAGGIVGLLAGRMTPLGLLPGMLAGAVVGALAGSFSFQAPDLTPEELGGLLVDLPKGKAGLVIQVHSGPADQVAEEITKLNGKVKEYGLRTTAAPSSSRQAVASASSVA